MRKLKKCIPNYSLGSAGYESAQVLKLDGQMRELAERLKGEQSLLVFGRGYNFATALEAALKVKEVALMHRCAVPRCAALCTLCTLCSICMLGWAELCCAALGWAEISWAVLCCAVLNGAGVGCDGLCALCWAVAGWAALRWVWPAALLGGAVECAAAEPEGM